MSEKVSKMIGNDFWKQRTTVGRGKIFSTPEKLWEAACEYFQWVLDNPLMERVIQGGKEWDVPKMRAMTIQGLCIFLDVETKTFYNYCDKKNESYKDFLHTTTRISDIIRTQKFEGASAGFLNHNIIARDLGLSDKKELTGKDGSPLIPDYSKLSPEERAKLHELETKAKPDDE